MLCVTFLSYYWSYYIRKDDVNFCSWECDKNVLFESFIYVKDGVFKTGEKNATEQLTGLGKANRNS